LERTDDWPPAGLVSHGKTSLPPVFGSGEMQVSSSLPGRSGSIKLRGFLFPYTIDVFCLPNEFASSFLLCVSSTLKRRFRTVLFFFLPEETIFADRVSEEVVSPYRLCHLCPVLPYRSRYPVLPFFFSCDCWSSPIFIITF